MLKKTLISDRPFRRVFGKPVPSWRGVPIGLSLRGVQTGVLLLIVAISRDQCVVAQDASADARTSSPLPVRVVLAGTLVPPELERSFAGQLMARRESELSFERSGRVVEVLVEEGDPVTAGQVIARLDMNDLDAAEKRTRGELDAAKALLDEFVAGPRQQTIEAARARVGQLEAQRELARANTDREQQLTRRNAGSRRTLDAALFGQEAIEQQLRSAKAELDLLVEGTRVEQIAAQRAICESIEGRLDEISVQRSDSQITAPFDGLVATRRVDPGVVVNPAVPIIQLISNEVEARFGVPSELARQLRKGDVAAVSVGDQRRSGAIDRLDPMVDLRTRTRSIYLALGNTQDAWVAGEVANVHIKIASQKSNEASDAFWLPNPALVRGGRGIWTLLVMPGNDRTATCQRRAVEVLQTEGDYSLVQGMVDPGERIIVAGLHRVTAGIRVQQANDDASSDAVQTLDPKVSR